MEDRIVNIEKRLANIEKTTKKVESKIRVEELLNKFKGARAHAYYQDEGHVSILTTIARWLSRRLR